MNRKWSVAILILVALVVALMSYRQGVQGETDLTIYTDSLPMYRKMPDATTTVEFIPAKEGGMDRLLIKQMVKRDESGRPMNPDPVQGLGSFVKLSAASSQKVRATRKIVLVLPKGKRETLPVTFKD